MSLVDNVNTRPQHPLGQIPIRPGDSKTIQQYQNAAVDAQVNRSLFNESGSGSGSGSTTTEETKGIARGQSPIFGEAAPSTSLLSKLNICAIDSDSISPVFNPMSIVGCYGSRAHIPRETGIGGGTTRDFAHVASLLIHQLNQNLISSTGISQSCQTWTARDYSSHEAAKKATPQYEPKNLKYKVLGQQGEFLAVCPAYHSRQKDIVSSVHFSRINVYHQDTTFACSCNLLRDPSTWECNYIEDLPITPVLLNFFYNLFFILCIL